MGGHASNVYFGMNAMAVSTVLLAITYAVIISEKVNRAIVALVGAGLMVVVGVLSQEEAIKGVDWNTIGLLTGMMILVSVSRRSGMFQYVAVWSAQAAKAHPAGILFLLQITTAVLSAFLDNVTTVLLIVPVTLAIVKELDVPAYPYLFAEIFASNIGGTATLIGDPPNILIGSQVWLDFNAFVVHLTPVIVVVMIAQAIMIHLIWGKDLKATPEREARVMAMRKEESITDRLLLKQSLVVLTAVMVAFVLARPLHLEPATIAMLGAAVLMLLDNWSHHAEKAADNVHKTFGDVEWITIFFFIGLFIVVHGVEVGGLLKLLADKLVAATGGNLAHAGYAILWAPAQGGDGAVVWRSRRDPAAVVVPVARRLSGRQRHADRGIGESDGRGARRTRGCPVPLHHLHALRIPDDAGLHRDLSRLCVVAILLTHSRISRIPVSDW